MNSALRPQKNSAMFLVLASLSGGLILANFGLTALGIYKLMLAAMGLGDVSITWISITIAGLTLLTLTGTFLASNAPKATILSRTSLVTGGLLLPIELFHGLQLLVPSLWILDYFGLTVWAGAALAIVAMLAGLTGSIYLLSTRKKHKKFGVMFAMCVAAAVIGGIGFMSNTVPIVSYFIEQEQAAQRSRELANESPAETLARQLNDYPLVKEQIASCNIDYVTVKELEDSPDIKYLYVFLKDYVVYYQDSVDARYESDRHRSLELKVSYGKRDELKADIDAARTSCPDVAWQEDIIDLQYDSFDVEFAQYEACNVRAYQRVKINGTDAYVIRVHLLKPEKVFGRTTPVDSLVVNLEKEVALGVQKRMSTEKCPIGITELTPTSDDIASLY